MALDRLLRKIKTKKAKVGIIGLGYVGLPLAMTFTGAGFKVTGIDNDPKKIKSLKAGRSYILDVPSKWLRQAIKQKTFKAEGSYRKLASLDVVIICVPTPLSKTREPDVSYVVKAVKKITEYLRRDQLVVLESTTYPGTTEEVVVPMLTEAGLTPEKDFYVGFSPERVDPGNKEYDLVSIPKVVGGYGKQSLKACKMLYGTVMRRVVPVSSAKTAETVKLLENTFRSVNIALINEMAMLCNRFGVDIWEVIKAAKTKPFGFMPFYPGPGIGGHCLPVDSVYLSWKSKRLGYEAKMIETASEINKAMPVYVVERITHLLNQSQRALKGASVLLLGAAYKSDIDDPRESPALDVMDLLVREEAKVSYTDPHVPSVLVGRSVFHSKRLTRELLKKQHCVVVLTAHSAFDYEMVLKHSRLILDTRNVLRRLPSKKNLSFL